MIICRRCGHTPNDHDAGECWAEVLGNQCRCSWYEPDTPIPGDTP